MIAQLKQKICSIIDDMAPSLLDLSHKIHQHPELAFEEKYACQLLTKASQNAGLEVQTNAFGLPTAFAASFGQGEKEIAILSEYDALPGIGHACGHNIIAVAGLGAALALARLGGELGGRVRYLGTPAEEKGGGKELMARQNGFDQLDAAMMVHPASINMRSVPSLCVYEVEAIYHGKSAHAAAMPWRGINALDGLITAYQTIAMLRQHIRSDERVHGIINEGGLAPNIVPEKAAGQFYIRAAHAENLFALRDRVIACFEAGAGASGAQLELLWGDAVYLDVKHNEPLAKAYERNAIALGLDMYPPEQAPPSYISTDMGNVSYRVPSIHPLIAIAPPHITIHNPEFAHYAAQVNGDKAALDGAKSLAMTALDFFSDSQLQNETQKYFKQTVLNAPAILKDIQTPPQCGHNH